MNETLTFTPDFHQFYKDLAANNDRDWFLANKKRYETSVKQPFEVFVQVIINRLKQENPSLDIQPKDAIFRINRDVRFSKDKTPYKLCSSAIISAGGKKDHVSPGLYIEVGPEKIAVYGGIYMPEKAQLEAIRTHIASNLAAFAALLDNPEFKATYGTLHGERNKILPKDLQAAAAQQPLLYNKGFYFYNHMPAETLLKKDVVDAVMLRYAAGKPMADFLFRPLA